MTDNATKPSPELSRALENAAAHPDDVTAQVAAAYACDREGFEEQAIDYYDAAWSLGIDEAERFDFSIGYGSTLRNVGRFGESVKVLSSAVQSAPLDATARCFLALSLQSAGQSDAALAQALRATLLLKDGSRTLTAYSRALESYVALLEQGSE